MEDLSIFRLFLAFPLIGLLIPDAGLFFSNYRGKDIPSSHVIIEATLVTCIVICSFGNKYLKRRDISPQD